MSTHSDNETFEGRFSDGRSARTNVVRVALGNGALEFQAPASPSDEPDEDGGDSAPVEPDATESHRWPFATLSTSSGLKARTRDALVYSSEEPEASLFISDPSFVRTLRRTAPQTQASATLWRFVKPALAVAAVIAVVIATFWVFDLSPARAIANLIPDTMRERIGARTYKTFVGHRKVCSSPEGDKALARMASRVIGADPAEEGYKIVVVRWSLVNAFALPGGRITLTSGLLRDAKSADEIAGILAHETGHVIARHPETGLVRAVGISILSEFVFAGSSDTLGGIGTILLMFNYSRVAEREADSIGLDMLEKASVSPEPLAGFFARLQDRAGGTTVKKKKPDTTKPGGGTETASRDPKADETSGGGKKPSTFRRSLEMLSTHPATRKRIRDIRARAKYATRPVLTDAEWKALKAICKS